jgi:hypothetical protein
VRRCTSTWYPRDPEAMLRTTNQYALALRWPLIRMLLLYDGEAWKFWEEKFVRGPVKETLVACSKDYDVCWMLPSNFEKCTKLLFF